jgi:NifB/MoaA-like Fe-S oxidoreductase
MLKSDEEVMLDGMKLDELQLELGLPVRAVGLEELPRTLHQFASQ